MKPCVRGVQDKHRWHQDTPSVVENSQIPSTVNSGKDQSHSKKPVLRSLLMGMSIGTAYLGDNLAVFRKSKFTCKHLIQSLYSLEFTKREMTFMSYTHKTNSINNNKNKTTTTNIKKKNKTKNPNLAFIAALLVIVEIRMQLWCSSGREWLSQLWRMEYYSALKKSEAIVNPSGKLCWEDECGLPSDRIQSKKAAVV